MRGRCRFILLSLFFTYQKIILLELFREKAFGIKEEHNHFRDIFGKLKSNKKGTRGHRVIALICHKLKRF